MTAKVSAAYVYGDTVASSWSHSFLKLVLHDLTGPQHLGVGITAPSGTDGIVQARNSVIESFLDDHDEDWLWWTDTDMGFQPDTLDRLLAVADPAERPIVGALCFVQRRVGSDGADGFNTMAAPTIYDKGKIDGKVGLSPRLNYERDALVRCRATGSACILIHRNVFLGLVDNWYSRVRMGDELLSEDLSFCVCAGDAGFPTFVHTGIQCTHLKPVWLKEEDYFMQRLADHALTAMQAPE